MLVAVLGAFALSVGTSPASAATPCWRQIIDDWVDDGRIQKTYELHCYREAIAKVPEDLAQYGSIIENIRAARQLAARQDLRTTQSRKGTGQNRNRPQEPQSQAAENDPDRALFTKGFDKLGPDNAGSVPLPLLILAGLALALIAAGAAGLVTKRLRARRLPAS